jgi:hypothetical protein
MSKEPTSTEFPAADFISENAVRASFGRRRSPSPATPAHAVNGVPADSSAGGEDTPGPTGRARHLRRWSVAELIARAVVSRPSTT